MKKTNSAIYIPNMDAKEFDKICVEKGLQFIYTQVQPHGRLIDADAKVQTQLYDDEHEEWADVEMTVEDYLGYCHNEVPTIIPAEEVSPKMTYLQAIEICRNLNTDKEELDCLVVGEAVQKILSMETINAVTKDVLLNIVRWCFQMNWEEIPAEEEKS